MKILLQNFTPSFKAHFYDVNTKNDNSITIKTDNETNLGNEPHFVREDWDGLEMEKEGNLYNHEEYFAESQSVINYVIHFSDTNKTDTKYGKHYKLNAAELARKATVYDKNAHKQPLINVIAKGKVKGKFIVSDDWNEITKIAEKSTIPLIIMTKDVRNFDPYISPQSIKGVILTDSAMVVLSHAGAILRRRTESTAMLYDDDKIKELEKLNGKCIYMDTTNNSLETKEISEDHVKKLKQETKFLEVPKMIPTNKILTSDEYKSDSVGAKAYNLKLLRDLADSGLIKDVKIPKNFALPNDYFIALLQRSPIWRENQEIYEKAINKKDLSFKECSQIRDLLESSIQLDSNKSISDIMAMCDKVISSDSIMVRSAFNDEDIKEHSAAGVYDSYKSTLKEKDVLKNILKVASSKWNYKAHQSRIENNIDIKDIKQCIIIQEFVPADYIFNIYTKTDDNTLRIDMKSKEAYENEINDPYVFSYNRNTGELTFDSIERKGRKINFNENLEVIGEEKINDEIVNNFEHYKIILKNLAENALKIEKELGAPQDIEGGLLSDDIYLWQTRNIVD